MRGFGIWSSVLLGLGLALIFIGERIFGEGTLRNASVISGAVAALLSIGMRIADRARAQGNAKLVETRLLAAHAVSLLALVVYILATDWGSGSLLGLRSDSMDTSTTVFSVLWPALLIVSALAIFFMELAYRRMPIAESVELRRINSAGLGGVSLGLALVFLFSFNYAVVKRDIKRDVSYFKTTKPSESTLKMIKGLEEPMRVILFYPKVNDVLDQLEPYFKEVAKASKKLSYKVRDHALAPELVRKHRVSDNGYVVILKGKGEGEQAEKFEVGTELENARANLKKLDSSFYKSFAALARKRRELHITKGHQEHTAKGQEGDPVGLRTSQLQVALERSNIKTRDLGISQGLAQDVPNGVPAVAVLGPRAPFIKEEAESLLRYVKSGGRLLVMVDPNVDHGLQPLLQGLGLAIEEGVLCSANKHVRRGFNLADRAAIHSNNYSSHPTVSSVSRNSQKVASILVEAGNLVQVNDANTAPGAKVVFPIRGPKQYWRDLNGNYEQDPGEPSIAPHLMAAVTLPVEGGQEGRVVVLPDGDFVADQVVRNPGNFLVFADAIQWLIGEEEIIGDVTTEEDVRIEHTKEEDKVWFYATSFGAPLPLLGLGVWMATRRRRKESKS